MLQAYRRPPRADRQRGQMLIVMAAAMAVLVGLVGLATDTGRGVVSQNRAQAAADVAAMAAAYQMILHGTPATLGAAAVTEMEQSATLTGFPTSPACRNVITLSGPPPAGVLFDVVFYDVSPAPPVCSTSAAYTYSVEMIILTSAISADCAPPASCVEVIATYLQSNTLAGVLGYSTTLVSARAVALTGTPPRLVG